MIKYCHVCDDEIDLDIAEEWTLVRIKMTLDNDSIIESHYYCSDDCFDEVYVFGLEKK